MMRATTRSVVPLALLIGFGLAPALAHEKEKHPEPPPPAEAPAPEPDRGPMGVSIQLTAPGEATLGEHLLLEAVVTDAEGKPLTNVPITFSMPLAWSEEIQGEAVLGTVSTDDEGAASLTTDMRRSGPVSVIARFEGTTAYSDASQTLEISVEGDRQLYTPEARLRVPGLGPWLLVAVLVGVWLLFLVVSFRMIAIARPGRSTPIADERAGGVGRRTFLGRLAVLPLGIAAAVGAAGSGLVGLVVRSPRTHENLHPAPHGTDGYRRTPYAWVGKHGQMREIPAILERPVSFSKEVLPILTLKGGPHSSPPQNQEPPHGIRLDTYEHIMETEGLVVAGKPEESDLVRVLLDPAMEMPPSGMRLPDAEIQLIASWVAQGARDN